MGCITSTTRQSVVQSLYHIESNTQQINGTIAGGSTDVWKSSRWLILNSLEGDWRWWVKDTRVKGHKPGSKVMFLYDDDCGWYIDAVWFSGEL